MRQEVIIGVERRRRWRDEEKLAILDEVGVNGASVSDVARAHDITRQHIYQWRQELKKKGLLEATAGSGVTFLPLVAPEPDGVYAFGEGRLSDLSGVRPWNWTI